HLHDALEPDPEVAKPLLRPMLTMSNREFKDTFGHLAGAWRGKKPLQRNAIIALAHFKDTTALGELEYALMQDVRPVIRGTAAWALGKIATDDTMELLRKAVEEETDEQVIFELENALKTTV